MDQNIVKQGFDEITHALAVCESIEDGECNIKCVNPAFCKLYGYEANELIGKPICILFDGCVCCHSSPLYESIKNKIGYAAIHKNYKKDGTVIYVYLHINPLEYKELSFTIVASENLDDSHEMIVADSIDTSMAYLKLEFDMLRTELKALNLNILD